MNIVLEYSDKFGENWPLTAKQNSLLDINHGRLVDLLDSAELLVLLFSSLVINGRQKESISSKPTPHEMNHALLYILRRRSLGDYRKTINCLRQSNQSHVAEILDSGGGRSTCRCRSRCEINYNFFSVKQNEFLL